jgi:FkbM family methyltransferase
MRRSMGQQGRRFVERWYNWQAVERRLESALKEALKPSVPADIERATWDHVIWAYNILLDREPEDDEIIATKLRMLKTVRDLRTHLILSEEFRIKNPQLSHINRRTIVMKEIAGDLRLFVDLFDSMIGMSIVRGLYESSEIEFVRQMVKPGQTVLDIGANIGFFTINIAALVGETGKVYAFEPLDMNAELLQRSIDENHFSERVVLECAALGDAAGPTKILFLTQRTNSGGVHLFQHDEEVPEGHQIKEVPMLSLDTYPLRRPVDFIKIDIEGAEPLALRGGDALLRTDRPVIMSEIHPQLIRSISGCSPAEFIAEMDERGYDCYLLDEGEITQQIRDVHDARVWSVVFLPRAK